MYAWSEGLDRLSAGMIRNVLDKPNGFSVRCLKDKQTRVSGHLINSRTFDILGSSPQVEENSFVHALKGTSIQIE